jgi:hypothetical protein
MSTSQKETQRAIEIANATIGDPFAHPNQKLLAKQFLQAIRALARSIGKPLE